jgi:hypothetical protein
VAWAQVHNLASYRFVAWAQVHNLASYGSRTRAKAKAPGGAPEPMSWHPWTWTRDLSLVLGIV